MPSATAREYLEAIYNIAVEGDAVVGARLAEKFHVAAPSVTEMMQRLQREGYVTLDRATGPLLTSEGMAEAESSIRQHRLAERFLLEVLGMDWIEAHEEAHALQHAMTPAIEKRITMVLGNPTTCPHGNPIPGSGVDTRNYLRSHGALRLSDAPVDAPLGVLCTSEVVEDESAMLRYLGEKGIRPGMHVIMRDSGPDETSPIMVEAGGKPLALGRGVAKHIWVYDDEDGDLVLPAVAPARLPA